MHVLADAAAKVTLPHFRRNIQTTNKGSKLNSDFDPVTIADQESEKAIRRLIKQKYPDHDILGEEGGEEINAPHKNWTERFKWVIDPIDGTRSYITGIPLWGTLIALHDGERVQVGMLDQPYLKERYIGTRQFSTLNGQQIKTSACEDLSDAIISTTCPLQFFASPDDRKAFERVAAKVKLMRNGYDCYAYVMLASGHMDIVIESGLEPYDIQALIPIIKGAGGMISSWQGGPADQGGQVIAAATEKLHRQALEILNMKENNSI